MPVNVESRQSIHYGLNFLFLPAPGLETQKTLAFQSALAEAGVDLPTANRSQHSLELHRESPSLKVGIKEVGPNIGQLFLLSSWPERNLSVFEKESEAVVVAYERTWDAPKQFVARDATIRCLYACHDCDHAFQFIWEEVLAQQAERTTRFGKPIWGGGLRFVMPPGKDEEPEPTQTEVKIESFLQDPGKLFVQVQMSWPKPTEEYMFAKCTKLLERVEAYINSDVMAFIGQGGAE
ncbi:MAG: hypothetical protein U9R68_05760 [Planctomycetota bacterium]|nr:hypothetical protein [Planctomycetota bacterium]